MGPTLTCAGSYTVLQVLEGDFQEPEGAVIYAVDDGDVVLYVGQTRDSLCSRLWRHYEDGLGYVSPLGVLIRRYEPESDVWRVRVYEVGTYDRYRIRRAEAQMIRDLRPCLNVIYNHNGTPLPERYRLYDDQDPAEGYVNYHGQ